MAAKSTRSKPHADAQRVGAEHAKARDEARNAVAEKNRRAHEKAARARKAADRLKAEPLRGLEM